MCVLQLILSASVTNRKFPSLNTKTCHSAFLASQAWASFWSKLVPTVHLPRSAPWHNYLPSELRDAHLRYAATHRRWEAPSPTFKPPLRLPHPHGLNGYNDYSQRWLSIPGTRWAWSFQASTREVSFCDLRTGLFIGKWSARGPVIDPHIESRSPNECVLFHRKTKQEDIISEYVPVLKYMF